MASVYNYCINYAIDLLACMLVLCAQENYFFQMSSNARGRGGGGGGVMYDPREVESHFRCVITNTI